MMYRINRIKNRLRSAPLYIYRWGWPILPEPTDPPSLDDPPEPNAM